MHALAAHFGRLYRRVRGMLTISEMARACGVCIKRYRPGATCAGFCAHIINDRAQFLFEHPGQNPAKKHSDGHRKAA
jgi:hypothetical protein